MSVIKEMVLRLNEERYQDLPNEDKLYLNQLGLEARYYREQEYNSRDYKKYKENQKLLFNEYMKQKDERDL